MGDAAIAMKTRDGRSAVVVDLGDMSCFEVTAYDLTATGCRIATDKVALLKEEVGLRLAGVDKLVRGRVVACGDGHAKISFRTVREQPDEKRREARRPVRIAAVVCGKSNPVTMKCEIVDASRSGCRLEGDTLARLPQAIEISIPGLDLPISGSIVWCRNNQAGVQLTWPFKTAPSSKADEKAKSPEEVGKQSGGANRKKRVSAFGG
ncbi:MAG: hypothetical protein Tsb0019_04300 [Roseibium sp.]